ncbi:hypermethylated in cancer 2 protein-like [Archocentrus centrarchus]|uniref:hypermethylated in cancer 2 protein-like n=1 Tax=Archocentrus centrarchus TaxID=63155 RepID=UPI0011E9E996|nr:hypermethylated in cancer 2 protein-like [Archocentrus centrarchus]
MEVAPCAQEVRRHAALLLAYLNLQRKQGQFCDLVLRQRQNPGQLYPAHRCVLAASSPVLASVLSSAGALVELQAPCLSDSVLAPLLDYVYTGDLPYTYSQQQYYSLLTAACYLQMDELQKALRARQQTEVCAMDSADASAEAEKNTYRTTVNTSPDIPSISSILTFRGPEETDNYSVQMDKEVENDQFNPAGIWQRYTDNTLVRAAENRKSSSSSPHPYCGAVPVICHSSRAPIPQLQDDIHLSHGGSHHKHSSVNYFDDSDDSSDDEAFGAFESPMKQHYSSTDTTDQFLLLDISTRPAELVSNSVQASMSVCMPSALSSSMPTDRSAHLSTPVHHPFQCSLCDRSFSQRGSLNRHVRSHLGVRPFPCPRCPMTFSRQYRVTEHMRVHQRCAPGNDFQKPPASST